MSIAMSEGRYVQETISTGITGLNQILNGGLPKNRLYLVQGAPGVGKTTLGMQYLLEGVKQKEKGLYISLSESVEELMDVARSHQWDLDGIELHEHTAQSHYSPESYQTLFHSSEVELTETTKSLIKVIERIQPARVVFDSLSELRLLAGDSWRYRREILSLKQYFAGRKCTVILLDDRDNPADELQSIAHGVLGMEYALPDFGSDRRRIWIKKMRGVCFSSGYHDYRIMPGGLTVFPRLIAAHHHAEFNQGLVLSGITALDNLIGGGLDRGSSSLLMGPAGVGKSTIALRYAISAAERGERVALYIFEENLPMLYARTKGLGLDLKSQVDKGRIQIQKIDPAELAPGEFSYGVQQAVEKNNIDMVVIDSLAGYLNAMPNERCLILLIHELLSFLNYKGVTSLLVVGQKGMMGASMTTPEAIDVSYLADTVLLFRYYEFSGEIRQAISVFKRRGGMHERTIRDLKLGLPEGIQISEPLRHFRGVMTGVPIYQDGSSEK